MKILFDSDRKLAVFLPASFSDCGLTLEQILEKDFPKQPNGSLVPHKVIQDSEWNIDSLFLDSYKFDIDQGAVFVPEKAKLFWKDKWREARKPILEKLDVEFLQQLELGDTVGRNQIVQKKQVLRDITLIEIPGNTTQEIRNFWPEVLGLNPYATR